MLFERRLILKCQVLVIIRSLMFIFSPGNKDLDREEMRKMLEDILEVRFCFCIGAFCLVEFFWYQSESISSFLDSTVTPYLTIAVSST